MSAGMLKLFAVAAMICDHIAWAFVPLDTLPGQCMHIIGRITGPIMFFFVAEGYKHTKNIKRYIMRLAVFAVISQPPYSFFWSGRFVGNATGNVIFTLCLGLLALVAMDRIKSWLIRLLLFFALLLLSSKCDWSYWGVLFIMAFAKTHDRQGQSIYFVIISGLRYVERSGLTLITAQTLTANAFQMATLLALPVLWLYNGKRGTFGKWFFYILYPVHLLVLGAIKWINWL